jgi:hypothetical protein
LCSEIVEGPDRVPPEQELVSEVRSDEPRAARDEYPLHTSVHSHDMCKPATARILNSTTLVW